MIEAYSVGTTLKLQDLISAPLAKIGTQLKDMDVIVSALNKNLKALGAETAGIKGLSNAAGSLDKHLAAANLQSERLERNLASIKALGLTVPSGGTAMPILRYPSGRPAWGGGGHGGWGGGHSGGIHMGPNGFGMTAATIGMGELMMPAAAAGAGIYITKKFYDAGKEFDLEFNRFKALGLTNEQNTEAQAFVRNMKTFGVSMSQNMVLFRDAQTVFRDSGTLEHAKIVAPVLAKMHLANSYLGGEEHAGEMEHKFMDFLRVIELRKGLSSTDEFQRQANMVQQVLTTSGGRVDPTQLLNFMKTGGTAAYGLSNRAMYYQLEPLLQEFGGQRLGTALQTSYNRLQLGIGVSGTAANEMLRLGLLDKNKIELNSLGGFKRYKSGQNALVGADLMRDSPVDFFEKVVLPLYAKKGITKEEDILRENALIFGRTGGAMYNSIYRQLGNIRKGEKMSESALNIDQAVEMAKKSPQGAELEFEAAWKDFKTEFGKSVLPQVTQLLTGGAELLRTVSKFYAEHEDLFKLLSAGASPFTGGKSFFESAKNLVFGSDKPVQVTTQVNLDGRKVAENTSTHQAREASRPMSGSTSVDRGMSMPPVAAAH